MRKLFGICLSICLMTVIFAGCGSSATPDSSMAADSSLSVVQVSESAAVPTSEPDVYIIATDTAFAPFEFQDENENYVGIDIDLLAAIAQDQGFEYELQPIGFNAAVDALTSGAAHGVMAGMSITPDRQQIYDFSTPYYNSGIVMAVSAENDDITGYDDLEGLQVAVKSNTEGAVFAQSIAEAYGFTLAYFEDSPLMYQDVVSGESAACFEDYPVMGYSIAQGNGLKIVTNMEQGSSYGFAVLSGQHAMLLEMFNQGLENIIENGIYQQIVDSYISTS